MLDINANSVFFVFYVMAEVFPFFPFYLKVAWTIYCVKVLVGLATAIVLFEIKNSNKVLHLG